MAVLYLKKLAIVAFVLALIGAIGSTSDAQGSSYEQFAKSASWGLSLRGLQLGIVGGNAAYQAGNPIDIIVLVRNNGRGILVEPLESQMFKTRLVDARGNLLALKADWPAAELNTTGHTGDFLETNSILKSHLRIDQRYNSVPRGAYKLTVSVNVFEGSSFGAPSKPVFARLTSRTVSIAVQ